MSNILIRFQQAWLARAETAPVEPGVHDAGHTPAGARMQSIDILRGFDMFWISGGEAFFHALALATGWTTAVWFAGQLTHTRWEGMTFYDLIQPLFLFITGLTLPMSVGRRLARGQSRWEVFKRMALRMIVLILLGHLDKNGPVSFDFAEVRFAGLLQRIGVAGLIASVIMMFARPRAQIAWVVGILVVSWGLLTFVPAPGQPTVTYEMGRNIIDYVDQHIMPGKLASGVHDATGWTAMPTVVATVLLGALAGAWLLSAGSVGRKVAGLLGAGAIMVVLGWLWGHQLPIIKHLWTSSYVLYTAGWSCLLLGLFHGIVDGLRWHRWGLPFLLIGMNPLVIYLLTNTRWIDFRYIAKFFLGFSYSHSSRAMLPVWQASATMLVEFIFLYWLYRKKFFWRV